MADLPVFMGKKCIDCDLFYDVQDERGNPTGKYGCAMEFDKDADPDADACNQFEPIVDVPEDEDQ